MTGRRKVHSLTGRIDAKLMSEAFKAVKRNRGAAGVDKQSIALFEANLEENLAALMRRLKKRGTYQPKPLRRVYIPKGKGKLRPLGIPAVRDRVAQEVVRRLLEPIWEPTFHENSFGFRPKRGCHDALEMVLTIAREGYRAVLDADISGFFDNIPHQVIMDLIRSRVADGNILDILELFLSSGVMEDGKFIPTHMGTPQGGVVSPLLANIVLDVLDHDLTESGYRHVRYADDFVVLCKTQAEAERALALVTRVLEEKLGLSLSPEKTHIATFSEGFDFLGFHVQSHGITMRTKSVEKYKENIRSLTVRKHGLSAETLRRLNRVNRGIANYFATEWSTVAYQFRCLDEWVRMRLRCMKRGRKSRRDNTRLSNHWLSRRGLVSLRAFAGLGDRTE